VIGKRDDEILPPQSAETLTEIKRRALETGDPVREEVTYELPNGERVAYDLTVEPFRNESGEIVGLTSAALDITERREREAELERTTDLLEQAGRIARIGGWEFDLTADPPEMTWTDELYDIHGVEPETEIDVETAVDLYHSDDREYIQEKFQAAIERGEGYDMEVRIQSDRTSTGGCERWASPSTKTARSSNSAGRYRTSPNRRSAKRNCGRPRTACRSSSRRRRSASSGPPRKGASRSGTTRWSGYSGGPPRRYWGEPYPAVPDGAGDDPDPVRQRILDGEAVTQVELQRVTKAGET